jgi:monofunctional glycosyltransferase
MRPSKAGSASSPRFARRPDRSSGYAGLESRQAESLRRALASARSPLALPGELLPYPLAARPREGPRVRALGIAKSVFVWIIALHLCYVCWTSLLIAIYRFADPPATVLMAYRKWGFGWDIKAPKPVKLAKVPRYMRSMLVSIEDGKFYEHHGIDLEAFANAREINKRLGKPLYGGSTLTMQVARTLFLVPEKSYVRKYLEVIAALELEALLPKARILELYFGYAEWGKGVFGMEVAARKWYGEGIASLSRDEAARLVALLSSPIKYGPGTLGKSGILRERYAYLARRYVYADSAAPSAPAAADAKPEPVSGPGLSVAPPSLEPVSDSDAEADPAP